MQVYLAGKINKHDWRSCIIKDLWDFSTVTVTDIAYKVNRSYEYVLSNHTIETYVPSIYCCGPFFLACDHGCYHQDNGHAIKEGCGDVDFSPLQVKSICLKQIRRASLVFVYLAQEDLNPFGTITEVGYARALNKKIVFVFSDNQTKQFYSALYEDSDEVVVNDNPVQVFENYFIKQNV